MAFKGPSCYVYSPGFNATSLALLLAPDIVELILDGQQPAGLGLPRLMEPFPVVWSEQRTCLMNPSKGLHGSSLNSAS